jgi:hypothetical protein
MYTVKELIEALKQCPEDYTISMCEEGEYFALMSIGIDNEERTVDLFDN